VTVHNIGESDETRRARAQDLRRAADMYERGEAAGVAAVVILADGSSEEMVSLRPDATGLVATVMHTRLHQLAKWLMAWIDG